MIISEDYESLMFDGELPERFRAGFFCLYEEEIATLRDFVDSFYAAAEENGYVTLEDFTNLMDLLDMILIADTDEVQDIIADVFIKCAEMQNRLPKQ